MDALCKLNPNRLIHITNFGNYQMSHIDIISSAKELKKQNQRKTKESVDGENDVEMKSEILVSSDAILFVKNEKRVPSTRRTRLL